MELKVVIILIFLTSQTTSNAPYCFYELKVHRSNYTCVIDAGNLEFTNLNEIWGDHQENKQNKDVTMLTINKNSKEFLKQFPAKFCQVFQNLEFIDMSEASISTVSNNALDKCSKLLMIKFYKNKIREINENIFDKNGKLIELHLNYNKFMKLPELLFEKLEVLSFLDVSGNYIDYLPAGIFSSLSKLKTLKLDFNYLKSLNLAWFKNLRNLQDLDLSFNRVKELPENIFDALTNLRTLGLSNNKLAVINSNSFGYHPSLKTILLESNHIYSMDKKFILNNQVDVLNFKRNKCGKSLIYTTKDLMIKHLRGCFDNFTKDQEHQDFPFTPLDLLLTSTSTETSSTSRIIGTTSTKIVTSTTVPPTTSKTTKLRTTTTTKSTTTTSTTLKPSVVTIASSRLDAEETCGITENGTPLIVEGENFNRGSYPWMAVLINKTNDVHCGGVLVSRRKVLTAAHCIITKTRIVYSKDDLKVLLGSHDLSLIHEINRIVILIEDIKVHDNWNHELDAFINDIAVVVLSDEPDHNAKISPICLTSPDSPVLSVTEGTVIGYGKTEDTSKKYSQIPKRAHTPIHKIKTCIRQYPGIQQFASKTSFCGGHGNGTGACLGDSGGGLFASYNNTYYLFGIVSASLTNTKIGCDVHSYTLYTNVTMFFQWIQDIKPSEISNRGSFITPWSPTQPVESSAKKSSQLFQGGPVWTD
ncbi:unnamed protein product [Chironomus riparius]|uniref:Peptidase S1 domain-containing protein n=1 Tax=Chironomus riparius TaxID=315576 RepID=A0A9N9WY06_9DIPT|nr:unnamed protein product [Chironomus riparius]